MKTVVLGAGSLGCIFGGFLAEAGNDVILIGRRKSHTDAINEKGLVITGVKGDHVIKVKATHDPKEVKSGDFLILITKTMDTVAALDSVSHLYGMIKYAVSLQNGMMKDEHLIQRFGREKVIGGTTMTGGMLQGDAKVYYTTDGTTSFGEFDGRRSERVENIVRMFNEAGLKAEAVDDIRSVEWTKLVLATPGLGTSALTRLPIHKIQKSPHLASVYAQLVREAIQVAKKDGARLKEYPALELIKRIVEAPDLEKATEAVVQNGLAIEKAGQTSIMASMAQSIIAGRKTEIDETVGWIAKRAKELGVNAPTIDLVARLIKGIDEYLK